MGYVAFFAVIVFAIGLYANIKLIQIVVKREKELSDCRDQRMNATTETLNNIKMLKLYSWIDYFKNRIDSLRDLELNFMKRRMNITCLIITSHRLFP